jgi:SAM-dependent methyltransferase
LGDHSGRYAFAAQYCSGKRVLDAGCGIGYGSSHLINSGAKQVVAVDIAEEALAEARSCFSHSDIQFVSGDVEQLDKCLQGATPFEVVVNFENLEHLQHADRFLEGASRHLVRPDGILIVSTPNGAISRYDAEGRPANPFHVREYTRDELIRLLSPFVERLEMFGQWQTPDAKMRIASERRLFEQLCELYFNPACRLGRAIKRLFGKPTASPPEFHGEGESFSWEYRIAPLNAPPYLWEPTVLIAIGRVRCDC